MATRRISYWGDSRAYGLGDARGILAGPNPTSTVTTPYTSVPQVNLVTGGSGAGGVLDARIDATGRLFIGITDHGSGYVTGQMPTIQIVPGTSGGVGGDYGFFTDPGGGYVPGVETYLRANGFPGILVLDTSLIGEPMCVGGSANPSQIDAYRYVIAEIAAADKVNALIVIDLGVNDAVLLGISAADYGTALAAIAGKLITDGYLVVINKAFGVGPTFTTNAQGTAAQINARMGDYAAQVDSFITANSGKAFAGWNGFAYMANHPEHFSPDGVHLTPAGNDAIAPLIGAAMATALNQAVQTGATNTSGSYASVPSNEASVTPGYIPNAPTITSFSGKGTFLAPQVVLNWTAGTWGRISVQRLTVGASGAAGLYAEVGSVIASTVGDPTTVPVTYTDHSVINGVAYKFQLIAYPN